MTISLAYELVDRDVCFPLSSHNWIGDEMMCRPLSRIRLLYVFGGMDINDWSEFLEFLSRNFSIIETSDDDKVEDKLEVMKVIGGWIGKRKSVIYDPNVATYKQADIKPTFEDVWSPFILGSITSPFVKYSHLSGTSFAMYSNSSLGIRHEVVRSNISTLRKTWNNTQSLPPSPVFQYNSIWTPTIQDLNCLTYQDKTGRMLHTSLLSQLESDHSSTTGTYRTTWKPPTNCTDSFMSNSSFGSADSQNEPTSSLTSFNFHVSNGHASTPKKTGSDLPVQRRCSFCKENGASVEFYSSHNLKAAFGGKVLCPILRSLRCEICGETGDYAHTKRFCTYNKTKSKKKGNGQNKKV